MAFYNTYVTYNGDGTTTDFSIPFTYKASTEVVVTRKDGAVSFIFLSTNVIRLSAPLAIGDVLNIGRETNVDTAVVTYRNGAAWTAQQLNASIIQLLNSAQEVKDQVNRGLFLNLAGVFDFQNKRGINVAAPTGANDLVNKAYVDAITTAAGNVPSPLAGNVGKYLKATSVGVWTWSPNAAMEGANNLSDLTSVPTARTNLGVYSTATVDSNIAAAQAAATAAGAASGAATGAANAIAANPGGYKNKVWNPRFEVWQRGTSFSVTATDTYTADRWTTNFDGTGGTLTVSRQAFTLGQSAVPNNPRYFLRWAQSVAATGRTFANIVQRLEGVDQLAGQQITITFWAKADAARVIDVGIFQNFGTGGSPSSSVFTALNNTVNLTTSWQKFTVTGTVPSVSGKTLGSNNNDYNQINFGLQSLGATATYDFADVQVEIGANATAFELRPYHVELFNCRRYYKVIANCLVTNASAPTSIHHTPQMYKTPVVTGGGAGFATSQNNQDTTWLTQTTGGAQTLTFNAEL